MLQNYSRLAKRSAFVLSICLSFLGGAVVAQQKYTDQRIKSIERNRLDNTVKTIVFSDQERPHTGEEQDLFKSYLGVDGINTKMVLKNSITTKMNMTTQRYTQFYKGIKVEHGDYTVVSKGSDINYTMGNYYNIDHELNAVPAITEGIAFGYALEHVGAEKYMWQIPGMEEHIKMLYHRRDTSYLPHGNLVWIEDLTGAEGNRELRLAYSFDIYAQNPLSRNIVYVDAMSGKVLHTNSILKHTAASNRSKYSQVVPFRTANVSGTYYLYDSTRGNGVYTMSADYNSDLSATVDITSATNNWPPTSSDTQAIDAHWGAEIVYDYWKNEQGRLSWDGADGMLLSYVHLTSPSTGGGYNNAYWDGAEMNYGDGTGLAAGGFTPLTSLDVAAHEIGHGICQATANLDYNRESGAMNEGFSDCWAATIENYGNPHETDGVAKQVWKIGEEVGGGSPLRSMDNPLLDGDPGTYGGTNWRDPSTTACPTPSSTTNDNCYVHTNSGVLNHWYYFVVNGGTGTNDLGTSYSVNAIGFTAAANILYQTELALSNTSNYADCRTASINAAIALYGSCSLEAQSVTNAWHAVGVGTTFTPCTPQIGFNTPRLNITENAATTACPASRTINVGLKAFGTAITGGSPVVTVSAVGGTAVSGLDYTLTGTSLTFSPGDTTTHNAVLTIFDNGAVHDDKTLTLAFSLAAMGSTATIAATNDTMFINIYNNDSIPLPGGTEYHTLNVGTAVTNNTTSCFPGTARRAHPEYLLYASELAAAGVRPGIPISQIAFTITTKNSTGTFTSYAVGMLNTTVSDLSAGYINTTMTYSGNHTTNAGTDSIDFSAPFTWDGSSNVAVEMCYGRNGAAYSANDLMSGVQSSANSTLVNSSTTGTGTGCSLSEGTASLNTARPIMRFKQVVPPATIETAVSSTRTWDVRTGTEVYFYNPTDSFLIAGISNETNNLGCVNATISAGGTGFSAASFSTGNRSVKEITLTPTINGPTTTYKGTIYLTNAELASVAPSSLYLLKTSATTDAGINASNTVTVTPTLITGSTYVGFAGTFTGFGRYMLVDHIYCPVPVVGAITGGSTVCTGATLTLTDTSTTGTWSSSFTSIATVSSTGVVTGVTPGIDTIRYSVTNACGTTVSRAVITVSASPVAGTISGATSLCTGAATTLSTTGTGGTWSSASVSVATVSATGVVTGVTAGTAVISYTVTNSCGSVAATRSVSVIAPPTTPSAITGASALCVGGSATLADATTGGTWTSSNVTVATINSTTGAVNALTVGSTTITYTVTNTCGTNFVIANLSVTSSPSAGTIAGPTSVCQGSTVTLTDGISGGTWSSSATSVASVVSTTGVVTGIAGGSATISYTVTSSCGTATTTYSFTVNPLPSAGTISGGATVCVGATTAFTDAVTGGTWSSSNTSVATVNTTGTVTGVATGSAAISYTVTNSCGTATASRTVTVNGLPSAGTVTGSTTICTGTTTTLTDAVTGGTWSSSNTAIATVSSTGVVTAVANGTATISYTVTNTCGSSSATLAVTVTSTPTAGTITGASTVCTGLTTTLTNAVTGGAWSSSSSATATVNSAGVVTGVSTGSTTISYTVTTSCGTATATKAMTVSLSPSAGTITGASSICEGSTTTYTDATSGGTWASSNTAVATVNASGVVTGVSGGSATISYSVTNTCGTVSATQSITINPLPSAGTVSGASSICVGATATFTDAVTGGTWSSSNTAIATVSATGVVTGLAAGSATISYSVTNSCGTASATAAVTITAGATAGTITGTTNVCPSTTTTLANAITGGAWSSSSTAIATVSSTGVVTGVTAGTATISYSVTTSCGSAVTTAAITVNPTPAAGTITGTATVCSGFTTTLADAISGGTWSSSNTAVATVNSTGVVTGVSVGSATISYTVTNTCGSATATRAVTITSGITAGTITGATGVCVTTTTTLSNSVSGGTWSSSNTAVATVSSAGVVRGVAAGSVVISYTVSSSCGSLSATHAITVSSPASAGTIAGSSTVCTGSNITLTDTSAGGIWTSSNTALATVSSSGVVTGVTAGSATITYTITNSCGTVFATHAVTVVSTAPTGTISGTTSVCQGSTTTLYETVYGGTWSSNNTTIASISASGVVTGVLAGTTTISYIVTGSCGTAFTTVSFTVNPLPAIGAITGTTGVCVGGTTTLSDSVSGGTWSSGSASVATISSTGVVTGVSVGSAIITYAATGTCGTSYAIATVNVISTPSAGAITGTTTLCAGATTTLSNSTSGGTWSSGDVSVASISSTGVVTGVSAGTATISYTVSYTCGTAIAVTSVTVNPLPSAGTISGATSVCTGATTALTDAVSGGTWSSSNVAISTVSTTGVVTGVSAGSVTISYSVSNSCGTAVATATLSVNPAPVAGTIMGTTTVCTGATTALSSTVSGGTWSSSATSIATVNTTGDVTGVAAGSAVISYTVTNSCGSVSTTASVTVSAAATAGAITGTTTACPGTSSTLANTVSGGTWSSSNTAVATVSTSGVVTGVGVGTATISYVVSSSCGTATAITGFTVSATPTAGSISGATTLCTGTTTTLTDAVAGGTWSSGSTAVATISATGIVTGVTNGTVTISYTVTNSCGTAVATTTITVTSSPTAGTITGSTSVCTGSSSTLGATVSGGTWASSNAAVATISATGVVTGVTAGTATISYTVTNSCGTATSVTTVTVSTGASAGTITGPGSVCQGSISAYADAVSGGTWTSSNTSVATINSIGIATAVGAGTTIISYAISGSCGTTVATLTLIVNAIPSAGTISGPSAVCTGSAITLTDAVSGGTWASSNTGIATVSSAGVVTAVAAGSVTITYTVAGSGGCNGVAVHNLISGTAAPTGTITHTGTLTLCGGAPVPLAVSSSFTALSYQWFKNSVAVAGATNATYTATTPGVYTVIIGNGCANVTLTSVTVAPTPNPVVTLVGAHLLGTGTFASYQWYLNGVLIPGATNSTYSYSATGGYTVRVTDDNGCSVASAAFTIVIGTSVANTTTSDDISIFPNPANAMLHIVAPVKVNVVVVTPVGKIMINQKDATEINISGLANGVYMVMVYDETNTLIKTEKLIKIE